MFDKLAELKNVTSAEGRVGPQHARSAEGYSQYAKERSELMRSSALFANGKSRTGNHENLSAGVKHEAIREL